MITKEGAGEQASFELGHRRALDGLRGVAVLAVLGFHGGVPFMRGGFLGVDVFFVLSGFLITSLLYEEWCRTGAIRLRAFYMRRVLRLLPALLLLLLVLTIYAIWLPWPDQRARLRAEMAFTLLYVANWALAFHLVPDLGFLAHAWSLAIEEQFYLVWPLALLLLLRSGVRLPRVIALVMLVTVASAVWRAALWHGVGSFSRVFFGSDTRADAPLTGCVLALALGWWGLPRSAIARGQARVLGLVGALVLALGMRASWLEGYMYHGGFSVVAIAVAALILGALSVPQSLIGQLLASPPLVRLGRISYGVYLWHWPIFLVLRPEVIGWSPFSTGVLRFATTIATAGISFVWVERPFLRMKDRFSRVPHASAGAYTPP